MTQLGARNIRTVDPANVQAILATKFADFGTESCILSTWAGC
jgi:hypothetical protein